MSLNTLKDANVPRLTYAPTYKGGKLLVMGVLMDLNTQVFFKGCLLLDIINVNVSKNLKPNRIGESTFNKQLIDILNTIFAKDT